MTPVSEIMWTLPPRHLGLVLVVACCLTACGSSGHDPDSTDEAQTAVPVVVKALVEDTLTRSLVVSATVSAERRADVAARVGGPIVTIADEGSTVSAGDSIVLEIDAEALQHGVGVAEQDVAVAQRALAVRQAEQRRVAADLAKAQTDAARFRRLHEDDGAVSAEAVEAQDARLAQVAAAAQAAEAGVALAEQQLIQARHALAIAERSRADATLSAPLNGVVVRRHLEPGEMISPGMMALRIEDPSLLRLSIHLNADHRPHLRAGDTMLELLDGPGAGHHLPVRFIAPTIDPVLRTIEIRAWWQDPPAGVIAGQALRARLLLEQDQALVVPDDAIVRHADQEVIVLAVADRARFVPVQRGLRDGTQVIITGTDPDLRPGAKLIISGHDRIEDGQRIRIVNQHDAAPSP